MKTFDQYHRENPEIFKQFVKIARKTKQMGFKRYSARALFQVMRWHRGGRIKDDGFKVNNNYTPYYVRLIEEKYPEFKGFFEKRKSNSDLQLCS